MYSHEIKRLLELKNNLITIKEYKAITDSPQIKKTIIVFDMIYLWTTDNYRFILKIKEDRK